MLTIACDNSITIPPLGPTRSVVITPSRSELVEGESTQLTASLGQANAQEFTWTADPPDVVAVDGAGRITCLRPGVATIKATNRLTLSWGEASVTCRAAPGALASTSVGSVRFDHVIGITGCPQPIATPEVINHSGELLTVTVSSDHLAIDSAIAATVLPAGGVLRVPLTFDCSVRSDIVSATITVTVVTAGGRSQTQQIFVTGFVRQPS